jgi:photosystem II stability/assembly factor-like uncharacterized protein
MRIAIRLFVGALLALCISALPGCKNRTPEGQRTANRPVGAERSAKWVPQYRPPGSESIQGTNLGLFSYNSISVLSPDAVFVAADLPEDISGRSMSRKAVLVRTTDGGQTWIERKVEAPGIKMTVLNAVHFVDPNTGWVVGPDPSQGDSPTEGVVLKTTDGGTTWTGTKPAFKQLPTAVFFADANTGWIGGEGASAGTDDDEAGPSDILGTTDGGQTWHSQRHLSVSINDIFFLNKTTGWASGHNGAIYVTTDGRTWNSQRSELEVAAGPLNVSKGMPTRFAINGIHFADAQHGWGAARSDDPVTGIIVGTVNGGAAWSRLFIIGDMGARDVFFVSPTEGWVLPTNGPYIYHTVDGGHVWLSEMLQFEQHVPLYRVFGADSSHVWVVGGGGIFFRVNQ